jgi:spore photoproduct lyase
MFSIIYIEKEIAEHPKVIGLCRRFSSLPLAIIDRYTEVFNRQRQNFRLQKRLPALILAKKHQNFVLKTPPNYGIGSQNNYYFSHLVNCPFDCRYCFLQGMFTSAHFVYFVNQEDFQARVIQLDSENSTFFTGYDCDSLALESITGFAGEWLPFISTSKADFEFRTKSTIIRPFLEQKPLSNLIIAYTLNPDPIAKAHEHKAPSLEKRLQAMEMLQRRGWQLGLRFDPILPHPQATKIYQTFFKEVFHRIEKIHSVTLGGFRVPPQLFKRMVALYPKEPLFASTSQGDLLASCKSEILKYLPQEKLFSYD